MTEQKKGRKGGRKANQWSLVTFADIAAYLAKEGVSQTDFAKTVGVTSSTFHNWKTERCAPDEETQGKISALLTGKEVTVAKSKKTAAATKKITKVTARGSRGAGSSTLAALGGDAATDGDADTAVGKGKKKIKRKVKQADPKAPKAPKAPKEPKAAKEPKKTRKRRPWSVVTGAPALATNGNAVLEGWNDLRALAQFLKANDGRSPDDVKSVVEKLAAACKVAALFA